MTGGPLTLARLVPDQNMARFYRLDVQPSLFGEWGVVREWGRIGASGQLRTDWYRSEAEARQAQETLAGRKRRKGYAGPHAGG